MWTNNGDNCITACVRGVGIHLQPTFSADEQLISDDLVWIPTNSGLVITGLKVIDGRRYALHSGFELKR